MVPNNNMQRPMMPPPGTSTPNSMQAAGNMQAVMGAQPQPGTPMAPKPNPIMGNPGASMQPTAASVAPPTPMPPSGMQSATPQMNNPLGDGRPMYGGAAQAPIARPLSPNPAMPSPGSAPMVNRMARKPTAT